MAHFFLCVLSLLAFSTSAYGWGWLVTKWVYRSPSNSWAYVVALGVAALILLGGVLNFAELAYGPALEALLVLGFAFSLVALISYARSAQLWGSPSAVSSNTYRHFWADLSPQELLPVLIIVGASGFLVATLLPSGSFNFHDDFHTYFVRPYRMLQTGTMGENPFGLLGRDSFGAQSFLQAFIVARFAPEYISGFDPILCFLLSGLLVNDIGRRVRANWIARTVSVLVFIFINPQYVNISALYSGSLMILALIYAALLLGELEPASKRTEYLGPVVPIGLCTASMIALKFTFIPFAGLYIGALSVVSLLFCRNRRRTLEKMSVAAATACIALGPWIATVPQSFQNFLAKVSGSSGLGVTRASDLSSAGFTLPPGIKGLGAFNELYWGGSHLDYNYAFILLAALGIVAGIGILRRKEGRSRNHLIAGFVACGAGIASLLVYGFLMNAQDVIRYFCPILMGVLPASALIIVGGSPEPELQPDSGGSRGVPVGRLGMIILVAQAMLLGLFADPLVETGVLASRERTLLAFRFDSRYVRYNNDSLSEQKHDFIRKMQQRTEEGKVIFAWISLPFWLDYRRNEIYTFRTFPSKWTGAWSIDDPKLLEQRLLSLGVRYILWEYKGFGVKSDRQLRRKKAHGEIDLRKSLGTLKKSRNVLYDDGGLSLMDIGEVETH